MAVVGMSRRTVSRTRCLPGKDSERGPEYKGAF